MGVLATGGSATVAAAIEQQPQEPREYHQKEQKRNFSSHGRSSTLEAGANEAAATGGAARGQAAT
jgi:hypothetical protein